MTTVNFDERIAAFRAAVKNIPTYDVALALRVLTPGTDWRGCNKTEMAEAYAVDKRHHELDLQRLARMANARAAKARDWREVR
jgi:hypothetical protein